MWCGGPPRRAGRASPAPSSRRKRGSRHSSARGTAVVTGAPPCHGLFAAGGVFPAAGLVVVVHALPSRFHARERAARHATWCPAPHTSTTAWDPPHRQRPGGSSARSVPEAVSRCIRWYTNIRSEREPTMATTTEMANAIEPPATRVQDADDRVLAADRGLRQRPSVRQARFDMLT